MLIYLSLIDTEDGKYKFEEIYNSYKKTMFYVANDILKDNIQAEDAVHTSFIKVKDKDYKIIWNDSENVYILTLEYIDSSKLDNPKYELIKIAKNIK